MRFIKVFVFIICATWMLMLGCTNCGLEPEIDPTESDTCQWEYLGFKDKYAHRLVLAEPYLYVCACINGLWRKNIREVNSEWQYLGLADTTLEFSNAGAQDVLIHPENPDWLLVAYKPGKGKEHCVYRSTDGGQNWAPADSGLEVYYNGEFVGISRIERFLFYPDYILGAGHGIFVTYNFGEVWNKVSTPEGVGAHFVSLERHRLAQNVVWFGGTGLLDNPVLASSSDGGFTWREYELHGVSWLNSVWSIAFDPQDANIVYVGMNSIMIKTTDGGDSWVVPLVTPPQGGAYRAILADPNDRNHLWAVFGSTLAQTFSADSSWQDIESPVQDLILNMLYDDATQSIYIGTVNGIYHYKPQSITQL